MLASLAVIVVIPSFGNIVCLRISKAFADQQALSTALDNFRERYSRYPTTREGLKALVPDFVKRISRDPWGSPYVYRTTGRRSFFIYSVGADGRDDKGFGDDVTTKEKEYDCAVYGYTCGLDARFFVFVVALALMVLSALVGLAHGILKLAGLWTRHVAR